MNTTTAITELPVAVREGFVQRLEESQPTVWDARHILAPYRDRLIGIGFDDGQFPDGRLFAYFEDVVHSPSMGFALVLRGPAPTKDRDERRRSPVRNERVTIPVGLIRRLPEAFRFLRRPRRSWPLPDPFARCDSCGHMANTGRFCGGCGAVVRRGRAQRHPGPAFRAMQACVQDLARTSPDLAHICSCGGGVMHTERYCGKCGEASSHHGAPHGQD